MLLEELKSKYALGCGGVSSVNMASAKKKLDEYHLKILRQLVTLPGNKECFDCHQRGPTYVNVTIGSFVCTTCSGMLRGLTPPHRVKSISMATFTPDEIDFVKARGNDFCRRTWLGLMDSQPPTKDEQQIKDFMIAKYERKRYYIDQSVSSTLNKTVNGNTPSPSKSASSVESAHSAPVLPSHTTVQTHPTTLAFKPQPPAATQSTTNNNAFTPEPFADFSKISIPPPSDPFNSSQSAAAPSQPSFANFDNNPVFNGSSSTGMPGIGETAKFPGEDRYAALKDLDCLMKSQQQQQQQQAVETAPTDWNTGTTNGMTNVWSSPSFPATLNQTKDTTTTSNPFKANGAWNNNSNAMSAANPFRNNRPLSTEGIWSCGSNSQMPNGFTSSQSLNFAAQKVPWSSEAVNNPFVLGTSPQTAGHHSSNPFL